MLFRIVPERSEEQACEALFEALEESHEILVERVRILLLDEPALEVAVIGMQIGHDVPDALLDFAPIERFLRRCAEKEV